MKKTIQTIILIFTANGLLAQTNVSAGNVSGTWTKTGSPYKVNGNIIIPNGNTLTIEPGVRVEFAFKTYLKVDGRIIAKGGKNSSDSIWFTKQMTHDTGSWKGVKFINTSNTNDSSEFKYCVFRHCKSLWDTAKANISGGITVMGYGKVKINNSTFYRNEANIGACLFLTRTAYAKVVSCEFKNNKVSKFWWWDGSSLNAFKLRGSAIAVELNSNVLVDSCSFKNNLRGKDYYNITSSLMDASTIHIEGSQFYNQNAYATIKNSIFDGNEGVVMYVYNRANLNIQNSSILNTPKDKSLFLINSGPNSNVNVKKCYFNNNFPSYSFRSENGSINLDECLYYKNFNNFNQLSGNGYLNLNKCKIINNDGGILSIDNSIKGTFESNNLKNCLISNNNYVYILAEYIENSTIVNNRSSKGGLVFSNPVTTVKNCIFWGNKIDSIPNKQLIVNNNTYTSFKNCLIQGDTSAFAWDVYGFKTRKPNVYTDNISGNPQFVNPTLGAGATFDALNADFSLKSTCAITSPAINAGSTDTLYMRLPKTDLGTNQRFYEGRIDIGCYEDNSGSAKITINKQPKNDTLCENTRAALLTYTAFGKGKTTQWQQSTNGNTWTNLSSNDSLKINNPNNTYQYRAIINGTCDKDTTNIVTVFAKPSPVVNLGKDTAICQGSNLNIISNATGTHLWHNNSTNNNNNQTINNNQTWWLQVTATNGCKSRDSLNITSKTKPTVYLGPDKSLHQLGSLQLDAGASQKSYLWNDNSTGQTRTFFGKDLGANGTYTLWVKVTGNNDCVASDSINITVFNNTSISQVNKEQTRVYPNPSKDKLTIETKENSRIILYDVQGKEILNQLNENNKQEIMISHLPQGIYTLQIISPNSDIETIKLIIEQ